MYFSISNIYLLLNTNKIKYQKLTRSFFRNQTFYILSIKININICQLFTKRKKHFFVINFPARFIFKMEQKCSPLSSAEYNITVHKESGKCNCEVPLRTVLSRFTVILFETTMCSLLGRHYTPTSDVSLNSYNPFVKGNFLTIITLNKVTCPILLQQS